MPNFREQIAVSHIMTNAIWQETGGRYRSGSDANINVPISGTSADYAAGQDRIPLAFSIYAPTAGSSEGWNVAENQIQRIVDEIFAGIVALGTYVHENE